MRRSRKRLTAVWLWFLVVVIATPFCLPFVAAKKNHTFLLHSPACQTYLSQTRRRFPHVETAYRAAVLSTLVYYLPFHQHQVTFFKTRPPRFWIRLGCFLKRCVSWILRRHSTTLPCQNASRSVPQTPKLSSKITLQYWLYNWFETNPLLPGVRYHDTDVLIATSVSETFVIFAGTASASDHVTNLQTFERASHQGLFHISKGNLHRGFLNAYSRVHKGSVQKLHHNRSSSWAVVPELEQLFGHCTSETNNSTESFTTMTQYNVTNTTLSWTTKMKKKSGCRVRSPVGQKLRDLLLDVIEGALHRKQTVHIAGHSLGGGLASLAALDVILNLPTNLPIQNKLYLWTFGAPQVADDVFLQSALQQSPRRLGTFLDHNAYRFVTVSDRCQTDLVSRIVQAVAPSHQLNLRGRAARRLGGVRGAIVHLSDPPLYVLTPHQHQSLANETAVSFKTSTRSALAAHSMFNYVQGISRESKHHPLTTDLPESMSEWLGD